MVNNNATIHSAISIRIVLAFLDFLSSAQSATGGGETSEKMENIKQSLMETFNITPSMIEARRFPRISLFNVFSSQEEQNGSTSEASNVDEPTPCPPSTGTAIQIGLPLVEVFHDFYLALLAAGFFELLPGEDYEKRRSHCKKIFKNAVAELRRAGYQTITIGDIAEALKVQGNTAMGDTNYLKAIELYSCALAIFKDNAVYLSNRAAAFTKVGRFNEAINDCYEAIKLRPPYVQAYYRLGCAYYEGGNNLEAIREGFIKVLQLDPHDEAALVSLQLAESKLRDELSWMGEQIKCLRRNSVIPRRPEARRSTVLEFRGPEEGGNGPLELVEQTRATDEDTISVANFIDMHARYTAPPE